MLRSDILKSVKENLENVDLNADNASSDSETDENIIIKSFSAQSDRRVDVASMLSTVLAQREIDQKRIIKVNKKLNECEMENSKLDTKLHYLRLDLSNSELDLETFRAKVALLAKSQKSLNLCTLAMGFFEVVAMLWFVFTYII